LKQDIFEKLDWIKGLRVSVHVEPPPNLEVSEPTPARSGVKPTPKSAEPHWARKESKPSSTPETKAPTPHTLVAANTPVDLDSVAPDFEEPRRAAEPPTIQEAPPAAPPPAPPEPRPRGRIGIEVPRSFYYHNYLVATSGEKKPSPEAIRPSMEKIESKIRESVRMIVPGPIDSWEIRVDMIPDDVPLARSPEPAQPPDIRRQALGWEIIGAAVTLTVVVCVTVMVRHSRRPEPRGSFTSGTRRFHRDSPKGPIQSERVRELVRRNPRAAASVLQRWIGQGGDVA
jgi:hypothetical protein